MSNATLNSPAGGGSGVTTSDTLTAGALMVGSGGSAVAITNTFLAEGTGSTTGAVTDDLITLTLSGSATAYRFEIYVVGFEATGPGACGYSITGTVRTTGAAATVVGTPDKNTDEDAALAGADCNLVASSNTAIIRVTGVAALTINWRTSINYINV